MYHSASSQYTTMHLSECMTVINSYQNQSEMRMSQIFENNHSRGQNELGFDHLPTILSLEVSACLHILSSLIQSGILLEHPMLFNLASTTGSIFSKIVCSERCALHLQKAYCYFVYSVLARMCGSHEMDQTQFLEITSMLLISLPKSALAPGKVTLH